MKRMLSVLFCILLLGPSLVFAGTKDNSTYVSLSGMVSFAEDSTIKIEDSKAGLELDTGFGISVAAGKKFGNGLRGEVEYAYQRYGAGRAKFEIGDLGDLSDTDKATLAADLGISVADVDKLGVSFPGDELARLGLGLENTKLENTKDPGLHFFMVNGVYDIINNGPVTPYLGAGIGVGWEKEAEGPEFAYQFMTGISYAVFPRNELIFGYRYRGMTDIDYDIGYIDYTATADSHNFEIGFRHSF